MFREGSRGFIIKRTVLAVMLLAYPCGVLAQRGAGGGHTGGGLAGGDGLSGGGKSTGVDVKDDLKDFHAALAAQATSQQIVAYDLMVKSTAAASSQLHVFADQLTKESGAPELASSSPEQAIEKARTANKKFQDGLSDPQKSGLKEITKRLTKADSDLEQQARALDQMMVDAKTPGQQIAAAELSLEHALTIFQTQQLDLGQEMSIGTSNKAQESAFNLPQVKSSINLANQSIAITTSGVISKGAAEGGQNRFTVELTADMSDLQHNISDVLRSQLDKADRCGERIAIQNATLTPAAPASLVVVQLHFERWACFGREIINEMAEGNGTIEIKLTLAAGEDGTLRLNPEIGRIDAEGLVGDLLRSGSLGDTLRDKIAESVLSAVRQGGDFKLMLPPAAQGNATLQHAQFVGTGLGKLMVVLNGEIRVSNEKVTALTSELQGRSSSPPQTMQETVPR
jgi:hypothetical protein